ncbi:helix-turn-helix domain-containing protein [Chryseobacterium candidae]|uniref:Helix-turn-helix domain-containing protein n=1 Tax=Chryseobacterium candidae TaxID=1978493 RepID=A0ABY2R717_9FLAO|nr:helix-turn-helix domain-containing protein [Chryseobacterium candidae]THV59378.1 helix-turn-helix domain-containing protein [Chryseobacterium candidae]
MNTIPNYKKIYTDMILMKYPHKMDQCHAILEKNIINSLDVVLLNNILVGVAHNQIRLNTNLRSYDKDTVLYILEYQIEHNLNNRQLAAQFNLSRNTVTKWKRIFYSLTRNDK